MKYLISAIIIFFAIVTNPTTNDIVKYLEKSTGLEQEISNNTDSPAAEMIAQGLVRGIVASTINRENYFVFSIYEIPMADYKILGIFNHFYKL